MQAKKATTKRHYSRRRSAGSTGPVAHEESSPSPPGELSGLAYVKHGDEITHVILPADEYERLLLSQMSLHAIQQIEEGDKEGDLVDADDFAVELARDAIVEARKKAGLTQKELGKKLGLPQSQISRIERRPDRTTVRTLRKMAKALNVNVSSFLRGL